VLTDEQEFGIPSSAVQHMYFSTIVQVGEIAKMTAWKQGLKEMTMCDPKFRFSILAVCLMFFCSISHAKVYDLGDVSKDKPIFSQSSTFYVQSAVDSDDSERLAFGQASRNSRSDEVAVSSKCSKRLDIPLASNVKSAIDINDNELCEIGRADQQEYNGEDSVRYAPKVSKTESFAMVLSGLGLLGLSIRRRKSDTFD
jgi:hypothetical protein